MKISKNDLLKKIEQLDLKLMGLWVNENSDLNDDDLWEMFVVLLETRVELLNVCTKAGIQLSRDICLPEWLEKLTNAQKETRLHELKKLTIKQGKNSKYRLYESVAEILGDEKL